MNSDKWSLKRQRIGQIWGRLISLIVVIVFNEHFTVFTRRSLAGELFILCRSDYRVARWPQDVKTSELQRIVSIPHVADRYFFLFITTKTPLPVDVWCSQPRRRFNALSVFLVGIRYVIVFFHIVVGNGAENMKLLADPQDCREGPRGQFVM